MRYRFGEHTFDPMAMRLLYKGIELDVPRRARICLSYLIEVRERVVKRDELIRKVWGRDNVSDHQLAQVVRAARNVLGDNGNSQCMIRTVLGVGYHWAAEITELSGASTPIQFAALQSGPVTQPGCAEPCDVRDAPSSELIAMPPQATQSDLLMRAHYPSVTPATLPKTIWRTYPMAAVTLALVLASLLIAWQGAPNKARGVATMFANTLPPAASIEPFVCRSACSAGLLRLENALANGQFDVVRLGLAQLPDAFTDSSRARMLEIELDIARGLWPRAAALLQVQQIRAIAAADKAWQAKLRVQEANLRQRSGTQQAATHQSANLSINAYSHLTE